MSVGREDFGQVQDQLITGFRLASESKVLAANYILPVNAMPVQYFDNAGVARTISLPLACPEGRIWIIVNDAGAAALTIQDDAAGAILSPGGGASTIATGQTGWFQKKGAVYKKMGEFLISA